MERSPLDSRAEADAEETTRFAAALTGLADCDIVVIDCPGSDTFLSRLGHGHADTLVTPINDSFVDFAMLAMVDPDNHAVVHPSIYSEMVWEARKRRFARDRGRIDWIVMRNRLGATEARNKRDVGATLEVLARRIGFRTVKGFGERVIFRELYLQGPDVDGCARGRPRHPVGHEPCRCADGGASADRGDPQATAGAGGRGGFAGSKCCRDRACGAIGPTPFRSPT